MKTRRFALSAVLSAALAATAVALPSTASAQAKYEINFGTAAPEGTPWAKQLQDIKKRIETESEGRIVVKLFLGSVMGGEVEMVQDIVEGGRLQAGGFSTAAVATGANVPALQLPEFPFLFNDNAEVDHILDTVLFDPMAKKMKRRGLVLAYWAENGWRSFYTKNEAATSLEGLRKHKMRVQESEVHKAMYKAMGVQAVPLPTLEVLDGLNRGTVDGFDNTTLFGQASGWFEPTKFYTLTKHIYQPAAIIYSREFLESLPEDLQKIVIGDVAKETKMGRDGVRALEDELQSLFGEMGVEVVKPTPAQVEEFRTAVLPVHEQFKEQVGVDLYEAVVAALKAYRAK
ncbi:MAG: TRAP transporter substrate-binding protein [Deltaproteobacteria bacterium]|nr:TRAP transporter substrate-binding protein [Deltaproteobacteria bacterium]